MSPFLPPVSLAGCRTNWWSSSSSSSSSSSLPADIGDGCRALKMSSLLEDSLSSRTYLKDGLNPCCMPSTTVVGTYVVLLHTVHSTNLAMWC